jgi:hypothetical protein
MTVDEILAQVAQHGGRLLAAGDKLHVDAPEGSTPPELLDEIRANKQALLAQLQLQQQMCFNLVHWAVETVAEQYPAGCLDSLRPDDCEAIRQAEGAMDAAALAGDINATEKAAVAYVDLWKRAIAAHDLVASVLRCTVDAWCARPDRPTIVLDTPHGEVLLVADRAAHATAIEAGQVVFSPLEVEQLLEAEDKLLVDPEFIRALIATKRAMPGARLEQVREPINEQLEEIEPEKTPKQPTKPLVKPRRRKPTRPKTIEQQPAQKPSAQLSLLREMQTRDSGR